MRLHQSINDTKNHIKAIEYLQHPPSWVCLDTFVDLAHPLGDLMGHLLPCTNSYECILCNGDSVTNIVSILVKVFIHVTIFYPLTFITNTVGPVLIATLPM
jgi:hypothetical protein